ncbi:lipid II flippase MurJ [Methylomonas montana]|uniref:lipid II flippase MurJ n=1 Tax=Methylomonas montana TaxID=3058963 RepID=UPI002659A00E|nr:lipid II flippase MurJ [Methylomonas montana]WKJ92033.1 lipid II flippase MurJ [Methylomonas montana]
MASYFLGFGSQLLISYYFGTSSSLDEYWVAFSIINLLCFYTGAFKEALVPIMHQSKDAKEAGGVLSAALLLLSGIAILSVILLILIQDMLVALVADGNEVDDRSIGLILYWFLPSILFFVLSETMNALLACYDKIIFQTMARLSGSVAMIACLFLYAASLGVKSMVIGVVLSQIFVLFFSAIALKVQGIKLAKPRFSVFMLGKFHKLFWSLLLTYFLAQGYAIYERSVMLAMKSGTIASFQYGVTLTNVIVSVIAYPLANLLWPRFLNSNAEKNIDDAIFTALRSTAVLYAVLLIICLFCFSNSYRIVEIVYARGAFDSASIDLASKTFRAAIFTAIPIGFFSVFGRFLMSVGAGYAFALVSVIVSFSGIAVLAVSSFLGNYNFVLFHWLISNSIGTLFCVIIFFRKFQISEYTVRIWFFWLFKVSIIVMLLGICYEQLTIKFGANRSIVYTAIDGGVFFVAAWLGLNIFRLIDIYKPNLNFKA